MSLISRTFRLVIDYSLLLVAGTVVALVWANLDHDSYETVAHALEFVVNDIGMAFFFALAAKEVFESTLPGGALSSPRESAVPILAAIGGMAVPAGMYLAFVHGYGLPELARGWAVPCATDIAFSYLVARIAFPPGSPAIPFLLLLAIVDDALGLVLLATFYPQSAISLGWFIGPVALAMAMSWMLRRGRVRSFWPYVLLAGTCSWIGFHQGGIHPALALVPIVPFMPHRMMDVGIYEPSEEHGADTLSQFEHWWKVPVQVVLGVFGFANAGVHLAAIGAGTLIVLVSLVVGKPIGIAGFTWLAERCGFRRAHGLSWADVVVLGIVAGIGFTVALFFAVAAFPQGELLDQARMGALLSFIAAPLALLLARMRRLVPARAPRPASAEE
ncbi:MAG: sodium:proton antiporter [Luteitalea sp.]|nr:sodium:proton antiporter [Luteitalea sp.]